MRRGPGDSVQLSSDCFLKLNGMVNPAVSCPPRIVGLPMAMAAAVARQHRAQRLWFTDKDKVVSGWRDTPISFLVNSCCLEVSVACPVIG